MLGNVAQIQCLDSKGCWTKRSIFINLENEFDFDFFKKHILPDKTIQNSYTTVRSVQYV